MRRHVYHGTHLPNLDCTGFFHWKPALGFIIDHRLSRVLFVDIHLFVLTVELTVRY